MKTTIEIGFNERIIIVHPNKKRFAVIPKTDGIFELREIK